LHIANILIIEDDPAGSKKLKAALEKLSFGVCGVANNCTDALRFTRDLKPDIILIDTRLNEFEDGIKAAKVITERYKIPHVYISSETDDNTIERSKATNPYGFLLKPIDTRDLNACLRMALYRFESEHKLKESEEKYAKLAEKLIETEKKNSLLINHIPDVLFEYDREGRHIDYRAANPDNLYAEPKEFIDKTIKELLPPDLSIKFLDNIGKALDTGEMQIFEYIISLKNRFRNFEARIVKNGEDRVLAIIRDITSKKHTEETLKRSLDEKEILLKEIHHRVKNNLQIVASLLKLQSKYISDEHAIQMLRESQNRVHSMSLIHQKLYQTRDLSYVDFNEYISTVIMHLQHSFGILEDRVKVNINSKDIIMSIDNAIPVGLIINELVSNSLKYAFPNGSRGEINICLDFDNHSKNYSLSIKDNGIGMSKDINIEKTESFGLSLVNLLVGQMEGDLEVLNSGGCEFRINFKSSDYARRA
jgi:PAS domain S-box-containing protein